MKKTLTIAILFALSGVAHAGCFGSDSFQTCTDQNGNTYNVNRMGNMTTVNGYNRHTGSSWNESANTMGNTTIINGNAANGQHWNETEQNLGNGFVTRSGTDSHGRSFSQTCTPYGCN